MIASVIAWLAQYAFGRALAAWWKPLLAGTAVFTLLAGVYIKGRHDASRTCEAASLRAQIEILKRDAAVQKQADAAEAEAMAELDARNKDMQEEIAAYEIELATRPEARCNLSPADIERLRKLGGARRP